MKKVYNFSAGPSTLPPSVLEIAQHELLNFNNSGMSVLELSHRSSLYEDIHNETVSLFKEILNLSDEFEILFIQGGGSLQFAMIPLNFGHEKKAYYVDAGVWGKGAFKEAQKIIGDRAVLIASSEDKNYTCLPNIPEIPKDAAYLHITTNNTVVGTGVYSFPNTNGIPLIVDMSSNILSVDYDFNQFDLVYAGAQKNLGPAGVTVVIVKKKFLETINHNLPTMLDYRVYAQKNSLHNTPPTFSIYLVGLMLQWVKNHGGVKEMEKQALKKATLLYETLEKSRLFKLPVKKEDRSLNNITFFTEHDELNTRFIKEAEDAGLVNLKGHRIVGGMRASIYNAMPLEGVIKLCDFIKEFDNKYGDAYV